MITSYYILINCVLLQTTESTEGEKPGSQDQEILQPVPAAVPAAPGSEVDSEEAQTTEQSGEQQLIQSEGQPISDNSPLQNNDGLVRNYQS